MDSRLTEVQTWCTHFPTTFCKQLTATSEKHGLEYTQLRRPYQWLLAQTTIVVVSRPVSGNHMFDVVIISDTFDCVVPTDHNGFNSQEL